MLPIDANEVVKQQFIEYLKANKLRKTPERLAILSTIYSISGHFNIDKLYDLVVNEQKFRVSKATLYNTLDLLLNANLIIRHPFKNKTQYEKCFCTETHQHLICTVCGKVTELHDNSLQKAILNARTRKFQMSHYSLYIYGICSKCQKAIKKKQQDKLTKKDGNKD